MEQLLTRLKALADKTRLKIIIILLNYDLCVGALAKHLAISEAAVSQQLQILRKAGLVRGKTRLLDPLQGGKRNHQANYFRPEELPNRQVNLTFICQRGLAGGKYLSCRKTCFDRIEGPDDANRGDSK